MRLKIEMRRWGKDKTVHVRGGGGKWKEGGQTKTIERARVQCGFLW